MKTWMQKHGDRVRFTAGYTGRTVPVESNVFQKTADYSGDWANGHPVILDSDE
jgi:hypothetical protein